MGLRKKPVLTEPSQMTIEDISLRQNRQNPFGKGRGFNIYGRGQSWISKIYTISKKYENKTSSPEKTKKVQ